MATIKINVMSIIAVLAIIFGAVALGLYEADRAGQEEAREKTLENELNMYEAGICLGILISLTGKTFLMFALAAILLLAGVICIIVVEATDEGHGHGKDGLSDLRIASYVLAGAELLMLIIGAIAPFIC